MRCLAAYIYMIYYVPCWVGSTSTADQSLHAYGPVAITFRLEPGPEVRDPKQMPPAAREMPAVVPYCRGVYVVVQ